MTQPDHTPPPTYVCDNTPPPRSRVTGWYRVLRWWAGALAARWRR
ncbi:hypothetical protein [Actinomadura rubrisoli]|nr:hypothetical protein [Actinomadura rubrisoli]